MLSELQDSSCLLLCENWGVFPVLLSYGLSPTSGVALCSSVLNCGFPELVLSMHVSPFLYSVLRTPTAVVSSDSILFSHLKRLSFSAWVPHPSAETWKFREVSVISPKSSSPYVSPLLGTVLCCMMSTVWKPLFYIFCPVF